MPVPRYIQRIRQCIGTDLLIATVVNAVVTDTDGRILLQKRADNGLWGLPGGIVEPGESVLTAVVREVQEETGHMVAVERLTGVYSNPEKNTQIYPNGDQLHVVALVFRCTLLSLLPSQRDEEAEDVGFFSVSNLPLHVPPHHLERIHDAFLQGYPKVT